MEISVGIIFSTFTKETSQTESDARISRLLQRLDKLRPDSLTARRVGAVESQASACSRTHGPSVLALLHPSRQKPIYAREGRTVNLHPVTGPRSGAGPYKPSLTRTISRCSSEQEHCHIATETSGDFLC